MAKERFFCICSLIAAALFVATPALAQEPPTSLRLLDINTQYEATAPAEHRQLTPTPCVEAALDEGWRHWFEKLLEPEQVWTRVFQQKIDLPAAGTCVLYLLEHIDEHYLNDDYQTLSVVDASPVEPTTTMFQDAALGTYMIAKIRQVVPVFFEHFADLDRRIAHRQQRRAQPEYTEFALKLKPY